MSFLPDDIELLSYLLFRFKQELEDKDRKDSGFWTGFMLNDTEWDSTKVDNLMERVKKLYASASD